MIMCPSQQVLWPHTGLTKKQAEEAVTSLLSMPTVTFTDVQLQVSYSSVRTVFQKAMVKKKGQNQE